MNSAVYTGDCLNSLKEFSDASIDMVYLDPPFYTQKRQSLSSSKGKKYEFSDVWKSRDAYLNYIAVRLLEMRRVLKDTGSIFFHCDTSACHYLRMLLDDVFGITNFRSEIIWCYKRWSNSKKGLLPNHQTILYYSKTNRYKFYEIYQDYSPTTNIDQILQERERGANGKTVYKRDNNGDIVLSGEKKGVPLSDVWAIPFLNPKAKERTGYPTQKPIELLERIISICTIEGDVVLDPFCGSGTTLVSAKLLGRKYVGIDINPEAVELSRRRLSAPYKTSSHLLKVGIAAYEAKSQEELNILKQFDCTIVQRNRGIDAFLKKHYIGRPVAIKVQRSGESLFEAIELLDAAGRKKNCSFTVLVVRQADLNKNFCDIPANMVIIPRYSVQANAAIEELALV